MSECGSVLDRIWRNYETISDTNVSNSPIMLNFRDDVSDVSSVTSTRSSNVKLLNFGEMMSKYGNTGFKFPKLSNSSLTTLNLSKKSTLSNSPISSDKSPTPSEPSLSNSPSPSERSLAPSEKSPTPSEKSPAPSEKSPLPSETSPAPSEKSPPLNVSSVSEDRGVYISSITPTTSPLYESDLFDDITVAKVLDNVGSEFFDTFDEQKKDDENEWITVKEDIKIVLHINRNQQDIVQDLVKYGYLPEVMLLIIPTKESLPAVKALLIKWNTYSETHSNTVFMIRKSKTVEAPVVKYMKKNIIYDVYIPAIDEWYFNKDTLKIYTLSQLYSMHDLSQRKVVLLILDKNNIKNKSAWDNVRLSSKYWCERTPQIINELYKFSENIPNDTFIIIISQTASTIITKDEDIDDMIKYIR